MIAVVDASAAIEIAVGGQSAKRFSDILAEADLIFAPDIFPSEITNTFWKYFRLAGVDLEKCERGIDYCLDLIDDFQNTKVLCREVFSESVRLKHPSYDLFYLATARRNNAILITKDKKLKKLADNIGVKTIQ